MQKKLISLALSAALASLASGAALAVENTQISGDAWSDPVEIWPTDNPATGASIGGLDVEVKDGIVIDSIIFRNGSPEIYYQNGFLRHFGKTAVINTLEVEQGFVDKVPAGNKLTYAQVEFVGRVAEETGKALHVGKLIIRDRAFLYVNNTTLSSATVKDSTFTVDNLVLDGAAYLLFGFNAEAPTTRRIWTIWVGYTDAEDGRFSPEVESSMQRPAGWVANESVQVGTINVGTYDFITTRRYGSDLPFTGTTLQPLPGNDTITINLNHKDGRVTLGEVGAVAAGETSGSEAPANLAINVNFGLEDYAEQHIQIESIRTGADIALSVPGDAATAPQDMATEALGKLIIDAITGQGDDEDGRITATVRVGQAGLSDATETVYTYESQSGQKPAVIDAGMAATRVTSANTVLATLSESSALGATAWRAEMNHLQYRMGELRDHKGFNNGVWARVFQGKDEYGSQNVENDYFGFQAGYDHKLEGTNVILGGAVSYSQGESTFETGDGDSWSLAFTAYGTWLAENGMFVDGTLKYGMLSTDLDMRAQNGAEWVRDTASYDTNAMSVSVEAGWRLPLTSLSYVEPQVELMYGHVRAADYTWAGYDVTAEGTDAFVGRAGFQAGMILSENTGSLYFRASVLNDFRGESDTTFRYGDAKRTVSQDLGGSWYELGLGGNWNVSDDTYLYADFQYADGGEVDTPWRWSVGVRHAF